MNPVSPLVTFVTVWPIVVAAFVFCLWIGRWKEHRDAARWDAEFIDWNARFPLDDEGEAA